MILGRILLNSKRLSIYETRLAAHNGAIRYTTHLDEFLYFSKTLQFSKNKYR